MHIVPDGFIVEGQNALCRDGAIVVRPGIQKLTAAQPTTNRVVGGIYYTDVNGNNNIIVGQTAGFNLYNGTSWLNITGTPLTSGISNQIVFGLFPFGASPARIIAVNDVDAPQTYTGSGNFSALGGSPPVAKCLATSFQRVILGNLGGASSRQPSTLQISEYQDPTTWPAANIVTLTDTNDQIVSMEAFNTQSFAIYKEHSQWVGIGAANIFPFIFQLVDRQPGPVSPKSVIVAENKHYYVGLDGDIYRFDGQQCQAIGGYVKRVIQNTVDWSTIGRTWGVYDRTNRELQWFFPGLSSTAGIIYRIGYDDVPGAFSTLLAYPQVLTAGFEYTQYGDTWVPGLNPFLWTNVANTYPQWASFAAVGRAAQLAGASDGTIYQVGKAATDDGQNIAAAWATPFRPVAGTGENVRVDVIESYFKQFPTSQQVGITLVTSDSLADDGTEQPAQNIDVGSPVNTKLRANYYDVQARFVQVQHDITGPIGLLTYRGSTLYAYKRNEA